MFYTSQIALGKTASAIWWHKDLCSFFDFDEDDYECDENGEEMYLQDEAGNNIIDDITNKPIPIYDYDLKTGNIDTKITTFKEFRLLEEEKLKEEKK